MGDEKSQFVTWVCSVELGLFGRCFHPDQGWWGGCTRLAPPSGSALVVRHRSLAGHPPHLNPLPQTTGERRRIPQRAIHRRINPLPQRRGRGDRLRGSAGRGRCEGCSLKVTVAGVDARHCHHGQDFTIVGRGVSPASLQTPEASGRDAAPLQWQWSDAPRLRKRAKRLLHWGGKSRKRTGHSRLSCSRVTAEPNVGIGREDQNCEFTKST